MVKKKKSENCEGEKCGKHACTMACTESYVDVWKRIGSLATLEKMTELDDGSVHRLSNAQTIQMVPPSPVS
jgi:hypothetical protein